MSIVSRRILTRKCREPSYRTPEQTAKFARANVDQIDAGNRLAAEIILADRAKYDGLPVQWAEAWLANHAHRPIAELETKPTIEERLAAHDARQRKKRIARRRERWREREWRTSWKGNPYLNVNGGFHIVMFQREDRWMIRITDKRSKESQPSEKKYATVEEAQAGAFDALLYMESRRTVSVPALAWHERRIA